MYPAHSVCRFFSNGTRSVPDTAPQRPLRGTIDKKYNHGIEVCVLRAAFGLRAHNLEANGSSASLAEVDTTLGVVTSGFFLRGET
jgi:hypothetical protein